MLGIMANVTGGLAPPSARDLPSFGVNGVRVAYPTDKGQGKELWRSGLHRDTRTISQKFKPDFRSGVALKMMNFVWRFCKLLAWYVRVRSKIPTKQSGIESYGPRCSITLRIYLSFTKPMGRTIACFILQQSSVPGWETDCDGPGTPLGVFKLL